MTSTAITNVQIFDGMKLTDLSTVVIEDGIISTKTTGDITVDGQGGTLIPGLIDSHIHLGKFEELESAIYWGVTTMLDMATSSVELINSLRNRPRLTDIRSCYYPAGTKGGIPTIQLGFPDSSIVNGSNDAERFVKEQVAFGADYIKIIVENLGPTMFTSETLSALVKAAHKYKKITISHASSVEAFKAAAKAGSDIITHTPIMEKLPESIVNEIAEKGIVIIPTLIMMKGITEIMNQNPNIPTVDYHNLELTIASYIKSGVTVVAGTDANHIQGAWLFPDHGESLHQELELLVDAGLTSIQALRSATSLPAKVFGLKDRGIIESGRRADLILLGGDPIVNIKETRNIKHVWIEGVQIR